jgi:HlyD family secretion protein
LRLKRWLFIGAVLAAVALAVLYGFRPQPTLVEAAEVTRGPMRVTIEEEGKTRVSDRYVVSAPLAGYARRIDLKEGDAVAQGQVITYLEPLSAPSLDPRSRAQTEAQVAAAEAAVAAARERVRAAETDARYWEAELARIRKLVESGDVARERFDRTVAEERRARAVLSEAEQQVEGAQARVKAERAALQVSAGVRTGERIPVRAPVGGRVLKVVRESEGVVSPGEPLLELGSVRSLEVLVELLSADAVRIAPGARALLTRWGGDHPLEARVRKIEPQAFTKISALGVEEQRVPVILDITSPAESWNRLGAGYRVEASFILWGSDDVLQAPASALFRQGEDWAVFTIGDGIARRKKVEIGHRNGQVAEILSGLSASDRVITHPDSSVEDGKRVEVRTI